MKEIIYWKDDDFYDIEIFYFLKSKAIYDCFFLKEIIYWKDDDFYDIEILIFFIKWKYQSIYELLFEEIMLFERNKLLKR